MKTVYILRGLPGSGKSTWAKQKLGATICSADDYFCRSGEYRFDKTKLGSAHIYCKDKFMFALENGDDLVIVDNTNTTRKEYEFYEGMAKEYGYEVIIKPFFCSVEESFSRNTHGVPLETIKRMFARFK